MQLDPASTEELLEQLFQIGAIQHGEFTLKSGITSPLYIDMRRIISYPAILQYVIDAMWDKMHDKQFHHIGGVPYAALPIASGISVLYHKPMLMPRKEKKDHGGKKQIEGIFNKDESVLIVEDIVTSGSSILDTVTTLEREGLHVTDVVVFLDREQGAAEKLSKQNITLHAVCTLSDLLDVLQQRGKIDGTTASTIRAFIKENQF